MIKKLYTFLAAVLLTATTSAQTPEKMSYQAVVRDSGDALVTNQAVGMQISILQTTATGTAVYVETQNQTTNINGLVSLEIGTGNVISGDFTTIDWSSNTYFIKTETDPTGGSSYTITGTSQFMSVPYALYAKTSGSSIPGPTGAQGIAGNDGTNGAIGATGAQGPQGLAGNDGATGSQGIAGNDGTNGAIGATGAQGPQGPAGNDGATVAQPTYTVGLWPELGGYVFWVSPDGKHGLVAETQDQGVATWFEAQNLTSNPANHSANGAKFRDWRMPTKYELNEMYLQQVGIGSFGTYKYYWSSTQANSSGQSISSSMWNMYFTNGYQGNHLKNLTNYVRSIRAF